jgi:hypothetical protein
MWLIASYDLNVFIIKRLIIGPKIKNKNLFAKFSLSIAFVVHFQKPKVGLNGFLI